MTINQQADGKTTASMDFDVQKFQLSSPAIQALLEKGKKLTALYPDIGYGFDFLKLTSWSSRDAPGGITTVTIEFEGVNFDSGESGVDPPERTLVYTRNTATREEPIWRNPEFLEESGTFREALKAVVDGEAYLTPENDIRKISNDEILEPALDETQLKWYDLIVRQEFTTFLKATSEWTVTATSDRKLSSGNLLHFGKIDPSPPGSPAAPGDDKWLFTGATENINIVGDGANSYSLTYTSGNWPTEIYKR